MAAGPLRDEAKRLHAWFAVDRVPGDPASTSWKRSARLGQARWREARGYPIGAEPYGGGADATPVGSRIARDFAEKSGANFISPAALSAAKARLAKPEQNQMLAEDRLWADLLSSMPLCFNLFGDLTDPARGAKAVQSWWPDTPRGNVTLRFEHSPGRRDPKFLGNRSAFDAAFEIATGTTNAIVGIETKYHEHAKAERVPSAAALTRYTEVTERSGAFVDDWRRALIGTELQQIWLDHLLVLSMLQHPSKKWSRGRFVLVFPAGNPSFAHAAARYRSVLKDPATFEARTIEQLVSGDVLPAATSAALKARYLAR